MSIVLVNQYAGRPELGMEFRPHYLAKEWVRQGHRVIIVASSFSHLRHKQPKTCWLHPEVEDGVEYYWLPSWSYRSNGAKRALSIFWFCFLASLLSLIRLPNWRPEAVIASSTHNLDAFPCWLLARASGAKLVYEVHDLWPLSPMQIGQMSASHPFIRLVQLGEDILARADRVISILPRANLHLATRGMRPEAYTHIPNGIDLSEWDEESTESHPTLDSISQLCNRGKNVIGYIGGHAASNCLEVLIDTAKHLETLDGPDFEFVLVGGGVLKVDLIKRAQGLQTVHFFEAVPKRLVPRVLAQFDLVFMAFAPLDLYRFGVSPNKIFDYMAAGKPLLFLINDPDNVVKQADCGTVLASWEPLKVAEALVKLAGTGTDELKSAGERGRNFVQRNHSYTILATQFLNAIK